MHAVVYLPLLASVLLGLTGRRLGRLLPPPTGVRLLSTACVGTALAAGFSLSMLAFGWLAQIPAIARLGHWSVTVLRAAEPPPAAAAVPAGLLVAVLLAAAARHTLTAAGQLWAAQLTCRRLPAAAGGLVILDDPRPEAYALPGLHGRVVVSTAMLRALPADERRVLLAHETSHLAHHHHLYLLLADLGAAANPLLRPAAAAVRLAVERWADEDAAAAVGDRRLAARALARAGLARSAQATTSLRRPVTLAIADGDLGVRARALLDNPPRRRRLLAAALATLIVLTGAASLLAAHDTEHLFEVAQAAAGEPG